MNMRFSTQAANADFLGEDTPDAQGMSDDVGADGTPRQRKARPQAKTSPRQEQPEMQAKPGKDIDAPESVKERDSDKP